MIKIRSAAFTETGASIPEVYISNVVRDGQAMNTYDALGYSSVGGVVSNVRVEGEKITCTTACSFATPGRYTFDVSATNAVTQRVEVNIPPRDAGGCGGVITGTPVMLDLKLMVFKPS
jgi:hypothetical protein